MNGNSQDNNNDTSGNRLLSTAKAMLVGLTVFFFLASLAQLAYLHKQINDSPEIDIKKLISERINGEPPAGISLPQLELELRTTLEEYALKRRYHQANVLLMSRIWVSYLSFVTGMILSLVGASFILGKIREPVTKLDADTKLAKFSIASTSPGIILATLGTLLIVTSILTNHRITVQDRPVYLHVYGYGSTANLPSDSEEIIIDESNDLKLLDEINSE